MRRFGLICLVLGAAVLAGCASRQSIQVAYGDQLEQLKPGMSVEEFRRLIPRAREFQRTFTAIGQISVWRLQHRYKQDDLPPTTQDLYFRFVNGRLNRWGYSQTWGKERS